MRIYLGFVTFYADIPFPSIGGQVYENAHTASALHPPIVCLLGEDIP